MTSSAGSGIVTTSILSPTSRKRHYNYTLLAVRVPNMIHSIAAVPKRMPRASGRIFVQRRFDPLETATVPLGEGINPPSQVLSAVDILAEVKFYGTWIPLSDRVVLTNQCPVFNEAAKRLGVSLRQTEDEITKNALRATASVINAVNGTNGDSPTELTRPDVNAIVQTLADADAHTIASAIDGELRFGTAPVRDAYFGLASTNLIGELENVTGFIAKVQYPSPMDALMEEYGSISNIRYLLSSIGSYEDNASALGNRVYDIFNCGLEAYSIVLQDGYHSAFLYNPSFNCRWSFKAYCYSRLENSFCSGRRGGLLDNKTTCNSFNYIIKRILT